MTSQRLLKIRVEIRPKIEGKLTLTCLASEVQNPSGKVPFIQENFCPLLFAVKLRPLLFLFCAAPISTILPSPQRCDENWGRFDRCQFRQQKNLLFFEAE